MKIAINGCGVGGPTLAYWLKEYGHEPVLFERAPALREGGYVIDFWGTGYDISEKMGILPALKNDAYMIERVQTVTSGGWTTSSMSTKGLHDLTNGRYMSIARSDLARHLFNACEGIETRFDTSIVDVEDQESGINVQLSDGKEEKFDLVVGADGLHSKTRELVFGTEEQFEHHIGFYIAAFVLENYQPRDELTYISHSKPGRQIARISLRDDQTLFLFTFAKSFLDQQPTDEAGEKAMLRKIYNDMGWEANAILSRIDEVKDIYFDRVSQIRMSDWTKGRVALIGDAAACASLLAGEGTGLAMTEAYVLAGELHKAHGDHQAALKAYQDQLHSYVTKKQNGALNFAGLFAPKNWFWLVVRDISLNLTGVPYLGKKLLAPSFKSDFELPDYSSA